MLFFKKLRCEHHFIEIGKKDGFDWDVPPTHKAIIGYCPKCKKEKVFVPDRWRQVYQRQIVHSEWHNEKQEGI